MIVLPVECTSVLHLLYHKICMLFYRTIGQTCLGIFQICFYNDHIKTCLVVFLRTSWCRKRVENRQSGTQIYRTCIYLLTCLPDLQQLFISSVFFTCLNWWNTCLSKLCFKLLCFIALQHCSSVHRGLNPLKPVMCFEKKARTSIKSIFWGS